MAAEIEETGCPADKPGGAPYFAGNFSVEMENKEIAELLRRHGGKE